MINNEAAADIATGGLVRV
jgi:hypothetical protein